MNLSNLSPYQMQMVIRVVMDDFNRRLESISAKIDRLIKRPVGLQELQYDPESKLVHIQQKNILRQRDKFIDECRQAMENYSVTFSNKPSIMDIERDEE